MKRKAITLLAIVFVLSLFAACRPGTPAQPGTVADQDIARTFTLMRAGADDDTCPSNWAWLQEMQEYVNVFMEFINVPSAAWVERKNLTFATGDFPDIMMDENILDTDILRNLDVLVRLCAYFDDYAPHITYAMYRFPELRQVKTAPDGYIYGFGQMRQLVNTPQMVMMNQVWLDELGLDIPTTTDELLMTLRAFRDSAPGRIPLTFMPNGSPQGWAPLFGPFGIIAYSSPRTPLSHFVNVENQQVVFVPMDERFKEAVQFLHLLFSEGLIDPEVFTHDWNQYFAKISPEVDLVGMYIFWSRGDNADRFTDIMPVMGPRGYQLHPRNNAATFRRNLAIVFNTAEEPQHIVRWFDALHIEDFAIQSYYGPYGITLQKNPDGTRTYIPEGGGATWGVCFADASPTAILPEWHATIVLSDDLADKSRNNAMLQPFTPDEIFPNVMYTLEELEQLSILVADIHSYVERTLVRWVTSGGIEDEWEAHLVQLQRMNVDQLIQIYQDALDRYLR